jgi:hypothetical protein
MGIDPSCLTEDGDDAVVDLVDENSPGGTYGYHSDYRDNHQQQHREGDDETGAKGHDCFDVLRST